MTLLRREVPEYFESLPGLMTHTVLNTMVPRYVKDLRSVQIHRVAGTIAMVHFPLPFRDFEVIPDCRQIEYHNRFLYHRF